MESTMYPYMDNIIDVINHGIDAPSRMGPLKYLTNQVIDIPDMSDICRLQKNKYRNENLQFIKRYIDATFDGLPESYMLELAPKNSQNLEQLDLSYGEILKEYYGLDDMLNVREHSKRQVRLLYRDDTMKHNIPPCTMGYQFFNTGKQLDMFVFSRSIDLFYGLTNDIVVFWMLQDITARMNGLRTGKFMMSVGNLHYYKKMEERLLEWVNNLDDTFCHNSMYALWFYELISKIEMRQARS